MPSKQQMLLVGQTCSEYERADEMQSEAASHACTGPENSPCASWIYFGAVDEFRSDIKAVSHRLSFRGISCGSRVKLSKLKAAKLG